MATNPNLIPGNLNRVRANLVFPENTTLNIPAQFQAKEGLVVIPQTPVVTQMQGMTTVINSEEPYQLVQVSISVIKSLAISATWISQIQNGPTVGTMTVYPDTSAMAPFTFYNCAITNWNQISMAGLQPDFTIILQGQFNTSNDLWNLV
jgi:hypothetical protein